MAPVDRDDFVFGGHVMVLPFARPPSMDADVLPERIITTSSCLTELLPDTWALSWGNVPDASRRAATEAFGVDLRRLTASVDALFQAGRIAWPCFVQDLEAARALRALASTADVHVLGLGIHRSQVETFRAEHSGENPEPTLAGALGRGRPMPPSGSVLGVEPLGFERGSSAHSWHCNGLATILHRRHGVRPNSLGLLDDYGVAEDWCREVNDEELGEPVPWFPWLVVEYAPSNEEPAM